MTKNELVQALEKRLPYFTSSDVVETVDALMELMSFTLMSQQRIEIRGFGSFSTNRILSRTSKNPRTGEPLQKKEYVAVHFKPAQKLREKLIDLKA